MNLQTNESATLNNQPAQSQLQLASSSSVTELVPTFQQQNLSLSTQHSPTVIYQPTFQVENINAPFFAGPISGSTFSTQTDVPTIAPFTHLGATATISPTPQTVSPCPAVIPNTQTSEAQLTSPQQDQESRLQDTSQWIGHKIKEILKELYKTTGSYVQLIPSVDSDKTHIPNIYTKVQLRAREGVVFATSRDPGDMQVINSTEYDKIFGTKTESGDLIKRLVFVGEGGVGKSTIFDKIAFDWAEETSEVLNRFQVVISLKMCELFQDSDLAAAVGDQLLDEDAGISNNDIDRFILAHSKEVLMLLDGFDEMRTKSLDAALFGSILKALNRIKYRDCVICVSTRPTHLDRLTSKSLIQNPCTVVEVVGFTESDMEEYIHKFHTNSGNDGSELIRVIKKSTTLCDLAKIPMLLLLMCLLWRENQQLPETTSRLLSMAVEYMFTRKVDISEEDVTKTLSIIGKTALCGLKNATQKFSFQENEFQPKSLHLALKAGILTQQRVFRKLKLLKNIQFMHKTIQEYCAAKYLQSLHPATQKWFKHVLHPLQLLHSNAPFQANLRALCHNIDCTVSNEMLLRFCCGDDKKCMTDIICHLDRLSKNTNQHRYDSSIIQAISHNCFFESQSSKLPQCLTRDLHISTCIDVSGDKDFRSLMYLFEVICRSDRHAAQLAHIEKISVYDVSSVSDLATSLGFMTTLRELQLFRCPLRDGYLKGILSSLRCKRVFTKLFIHGNSTSGGPAEEWALFIKHLTELKILEIMSCNLHSQDIEHIASSVVDMTKLTDLILSGNKELGGSGKTWVSGLLQMKSLHTLNLSNCSLQCADVEHIASTVSSMPRLTDLILSDNKELGGSGKTWANSLPQMKSLHKLNLSNCSLQCADVEHIALSVRSMPKLTDLILVDESASRSTAHLPPNERSEYKLDLRYCSLQIQTFRQIALLLCKKGLSDLILTGNSAIGGSAETWSNYLQYLKHLKTLSLNYCSLQCTDIKHIASSVRYMPYLTDLILSGNSALGGSAETWSIHLRCMHSIKVLNLSDCSLQCTDIKHIASSVSDMPNLTDLILSGNSALGGSAEVWSIHLRCMHSIKVLNLSDCSLQYTDIKHFASSVRYMPNLTDLILSGNSALGGSAEKGSIYLRCMHSRKVLNLSDCSLKCTDIKHFASSVRYMPNLTDLILSGNSALGGSAEIWSIHLRCMHSIKVLNLSDCSLLCTDIKHFTKSVSYMSHLTDLILSGHSALGGSAEIWSIHLRCMHLIKVLNLSDCSLKCTDIKHIASSVRYMSHLTELILSGNSALGGSAKIWSIHLRCMHSIKVLNLSDCSLKCTDIKHFTKSVSYMPNLTDLILSGNSALDGSAEIWSIYLPTMRNVKELEFSTSC